MARKKGKTQEDPWAYYRSIQLTPEQKAEIHDELREAADQAARNGVYEKLLAFAGKVQLDMDDLIEVRKDRD